MGKQGKTDARDIYYLLRYIIIFIYGIFSFTSTLLGYQHPLHTTSSVSVL
jgi:hypothetical protein